MSLQTANCADPSYKYNVIFPDCVCCLLINWLFQPFTCCALISALNSCLGQLQLVSEKI